jgi:hypothetical protein
MRYSMVESLFEFQRLAEVDNNRSLMRIAKLPRLTRLKEDVDFENSIRTRFRVEGLLSTRSYGHPQNLDPRGRQKPALRKYKVFRPKRLACSSVVNTREETAISNRRS